MSLQLKELLIGYGGCPIAASATAYLRPEQPARLLGPNGAGKSTLYVPSRDCKCRWAVRFALVDRTEAIETKS